MNQWKSESFSYDVKKRNGQPVFIFDGVGEVSAVRWSNIPGGVTLDEARIRAEQIAREHNAHDKLVHVLDEIQQWMNVHPDTDPPLPSQIDYMIDEALKLAKGE